jgi:hypothetical protein
MTVTSGGLEGEGGTGIVAILSIRRSKRAMRERSLVSTTYATLYRFRYYEYASLALLESLDAMIES